MTCRPPGTVNGAKRLKPNMCTKCGSNYGEWRYIDGLVRLILKCHYHPWNMVRVKQLPHVPCSMFRDGHDMDKNCIHDKYKCLNSLSFCIMFALA